ncbi:HAMP domain-containing histidine kinase [Paenibacillus sp. TRM 82003]|nr:HAMP domain-containing histidine kinase [Paenibacillus sp. TRM 82003]
MKKRHSLLWKYLALLVAAMLLLPVTFIITSIRLYEPPQTHLPDGEGGTLTATEVEMRWQREASRYIDGIDGNDGNDGVDEAGLEARLREWGARYPQARIVRVAADGSTSLQLPADAGFPASWTLEETIRYMKAGYDADPLTVVALLGDEGGFMAIEFPRSVFQDPNADDPLGYGVKEYSALIATLLVLALFMAMSTLFFYRMRRRLLRLQQAMSAPAADGVPPAVEVRRVDEIGQLEQSFNEMIRRLERSREREREEEGLRRQLIANLSHDLRTPLTAIRGHAFRLRDEPGMSDTGRASAALIDRKIEHMDRLIDNLTSYTLLVAGKYPYRPESADMTRLLRTFCAGWYPTLEREGFTVEVELPDRPVHWTVDVQWMERVLDNLFQNALRHAKRGRYLAVRLEAGPEGERLVVADKGEGMTGRSDEKGAGIGLAIVAMMLREMGLTWRTDSGAAGTSIIMERAGFES